MYIDVIIFGALFLFVILYSKRFQHYIFGILSIDILLRIVNFIKNNIPLKGINEYIISYLPKSIPDLINKYTGGTIYTVLLWIYVAIASVFLYFIVKIFIKRKKVN